MRNKRLDVLRGMAIVLVLLVHGNIRSHLSNAGWVGVDLFFVLSGFLISGLLFDEYKRRGSISFKRFFIRRGSKSIRHIMCSSWSRYSRGFHSIAFRHRFPMLARYCTFRIMDELSGITRGLS